MSAGQLLKRRTACRTALPRRERETMIELRALLAAAALPALLLVASCGNGKHDPCTAEDPACRPLGGPCTGDGCAAPTDAGAAGDAQLPPPSGCSSGTRCGNQCVDTSNNPQHCGGCEQPCTGSALCRAGRCEELPTICPPQGCPKGSYCDIASNRCVLGCLDDSGCGLGQICSNRSCVAGCRDDIGCSGGNICDNDSCRPGCRQDQQCGSGMICEGTQCVPGCRQDTQCGSGKICEGTQCVSGCRNDPHCPTGQICDKLQCRTGCRDDSACPQKESICDASQAVCVGGCRDDVDCNTGRICDAGQCRSGCRDHATCPLGQHCSPTTQKCAAGCFKLKERCPVGQACVPLVDGTSECREKCYKSECNGANYTCFAATINYGSDYANARCRTKCSSDNDCAAGYKCTWFRTKKSTWYYDALQLCAKPCSTTQSCSGTQPNLANYYTCQCDTADDTCKVDGSGAMCYAMSPTFGL